MKIAKLSSQPVAIRSSFKEAFFAEWARLNPQFRQKEMTIWQYVIAGGQQALYGYFAPLRMVWWLCLFVLGIRREKRPC